MHILHISKYAYPERGGIETFVRDLAVEQTRQGHTVSILCHRATPLRPTTTRQVDNVTITRSGVICNALFTPLSPLFPLHLHREIAARPPQVIHYHLPNPLVLHSHFLPANIPLIVHWHADVKGSSNKMINVLYPAYQLFEQRCLRRASSVIVSSQPYLETSQPLNGWKDKCSVVPLGLDLARYPREASPCSQPKPLILSVGRFTFYKGFEHLVRAASLVPDAEFIIAGDGPERSKVQKQIDESDLSHRVHLPGLVSDSELHGLFQQASLFCLPSIDRGEAFGITLLEAMRYSLPLISTAIEGSGTGWVNQNGITGIVVPPASPESIAQAIKDILQSPTKASRYGSAALSRLKTEFTISQVAQSIGHVYQQSFK